MRTLSLLALAAVADAQGYVQLDLGRRLGVGGVNNRILRRQSTIRPSAATLYQHSNMLEYIINVTIGTPGQSIGVTLDTGSSDLWVPTSSMCQSVNCDLGYFEPSESSSYDVLLEGLFNITYAAPGDSDVGDWSSDVVAVGGASAITGQIFGAATDGFDDHGVLGVGYDTNEAMPNPDGDDGIYRNVIDNLVSQRIIARRAYSIYLNFLSQTTGSLLFGGIDTTKYTGPLVALPLQPSTIVDQVTEFYVTLTAVVFNDATGSSITLTPDDYALLVLLDTGTSSTVLDAETASRLGLGLGAVDIGEQQYYVPCQYVNTNASISYTLGGSGGVVITVPVSELIGGQDGNQCSLGIGPPVGGATILGDTFLRSAYAVFDMENNMAALAQAIGNRVDISSIVAIPSGTSIPGASITATVTGTMLQGEAALATGSVPVVSSHKSSYSIGTPTFLLGPAATSGVSNAASMAISSSQTSLLLGSLVAWFVVQ